MLVEGALRGAILAAAFAVGCAGPRVDEPAARESSAIQAGRLDTTDSFVVGIARTTAQGSALCTGALIAPNLVATARRCVADLPAQPIDCATAAFGPAATPDQLRVTMDTALGPSSDLLPVVDVVVPEGEGRDRACGNDIALLTLGNTVALPTYVAPVINPAMTDHQAYSTTVTVIGYGPSAPTDVSGVSAGIRRSRSDVPLYCIPADPGFVDCDGSGALQRDLAAPVMPGEFVAGDGSACPGDWGAIAFEQTNFDSGNWVSFGVFSRGGVSPDGQTCTEPIFTRFDSWGALLGDAAQRAASAGGYAVPSWASGMPWDGSVGQGGGAPDGAPCQVDSDCAVGSGCVSIDGRDFVCAGRCSNGACEQHAQCVSGYCLPVQQPAPDRSMGAAACAVPGPPIATESTPSASVAAVFGVAALALAHGRRRRRRRS